jgi:hypothetical protein
VNLKAGKAVAGVAAGVGSRAAKAVGKIPDTTC